ncbi:MAG: hypothetical protein ACNA8L_02905 [Luteolibacter sp.]
MPQRFRAILFIVPSVTLYLGIFVSAAISYRMPKLYESFAVIEIKTGPEAPHIAAEKQRFASTDLHAEVSRNLELPARWLLNRESTLDRLEKSIRARQISGTDLLNVSVRNTNPEETVEILNALLSAYGKERMERWEQSDEHKQKNKLRDAILEQQRKVTEMRERLTGTPNDIAHPALDNTEFEAERQRLQEMRLELLENFMGEPGWPPEDPYTGMIVHDDPLLPEHRVSPNHYFNLTLGALSGLLSGIPLALVIIALLHRMRPLND